MTDYFNRGSESDKRRQLQVHDRRRGHPLVALKGCQLLGCKFRRQYSVGAFVIDFFSVEVRLGVELDGALILMEALGIMIRRRQQFIESFGIRIVRFLNAEVRENLDGVLERIGKEVLERRDTQKL